MKTRIIRIGNSQGIRIPKILLEQSQLGDEVEIEAQEGRIIIHQVPIARRGWAEQFRIMAENGDDKLLDGDEFLPTDWDEQEWEWD